MKLRIAVRKDRRSQWERFLVWPASLESFKRKMLSENPRAIIRQTPDMQAA